jgi:hypothetical protein
VEVSEGLYFGQCMQGDTWTTEQLDLFAAEWRKQAQQRNKVRLLTPLPRRVRMRLAARRAVDKAGIWLVKHHRYHAAQRLWQAFGMWRR